MIANNPATRMLAFDDMTAEERRLANEYGVNVVRNCKQLGAQPHQLEYACQQHRANRQRQHLDATSSLGRDMAAKMRAMRAPSVPASVRPVPYIAARPMEDATVAQLVFPPPPSTPRPPESLWDRLRRAMG